MFANTIARIVGSLTAIGIVIGYFFFHRNTPVSVIEWELAVGAVSAIVAFIVTPYITVVPFMWLRDKIRVAAASDLLAAAIGLTIGLILSALLSIPLAYMPDIFGRLLPFVGAILLGYLGITTA